MNNNIIYISSDDFKIAKENLKRNDKIFFVEMNGEKIQNLTEYLSTMSNLCDFPFPTKGWDGYCDWMTDFTWIDKDIIIIIINNYKYFLQSDLSSKAKVIEKFQNTILPWWENDVINHMVGGKPKKFTVYLVD